MPREIIPSVVLATGSVPIIFEPQIHEKQTLVDGGVFSNLDMSEAIVKCKEKGFEEKDIIIDIILCFDKAMRVPKWSMHDAKYKNAYDYYERQ